MTTKKLTKLLALYLPYLLLGLVVTNFGEAWRFTEGKELGDKIMSMMGTIPVAFANPLPSLHPLDLLVGLCCGAGLRLAVYLRGKNAKKYRHGIDYAIRKDNSEKVVEIKGCGGRNRHRHAIRKDSLRCRPGIWSFSKPQTQRPLTRRLKRIFGISAEYKGKRPSVLENCMNWCRRRQNFPGKVRP